MSDIRFEGESVVIEGDATVSRTPDFMLDEASRRSRRGGQRRALVHDFGDGLTANWDYDYPGGVTINGARLLNGYRNLVTIASEAVKVIGRRLMLDDPAMRLNDTRFRRALVHDREDRLAINYRGDYPGGVDIWGPVRFRVRGDRYSVDVVDGLKTLEAHLSTLTKKLDELEKAVERVTASVESRESTADRS